MAGIFDHLHIKRNTAGSSNELSFDVLDAARDEADASRGKAPSVMISPRDSLGSYHGVSEAATLSGQKEVERRKHRRRIRAIMARVMIVVGVIAAIGVAAWTGYGYFVATQAFDDQYGSLVDRFVKVDEFLSEVDTLMQDPASDAGSEARAAAIAKMDSSRNELDSIRSDAEQFKDRISNEQDKVAIDHIVEAADARMSMLAAAQLAFAVSGKVDDVASRIARVWNDVIAADQAAREAASDANKASSEKAISEAKEKTEKAKESMSASLSDLEAISQANPDVNLSSHLEYLKIRIQSLEYADATSKALLAGDRDKAAEQNDRYNEADSEAAQLAASLPLSPDSIVEESFDPEVASHIKEYEAARNRAIAADALIRERLGA